MTDPQTISPLWQVIKCFLGFHEIYSAPHFNREHMTDSGMAKVRYYDCPKCGREFSHYV